MKKGTDLSSLREHVWISSSYDRYEQLSPLHFQANVTTSRSPRGMNFPSVVRDVVAPDSEAQL